ncbi:MAG: hypothetical protein ACI31F_01120 [Muribaculaceae bacterium]
MREKIYSTFKSVYSRVAIVVAVLAISAYTAFATGSGISADDPMIIESAGEYQLTEFKPFYGQFVVPEDVTTDNVVLEIVAYDRIQAYSDAEMTNEIGTIEGNGSPYTTTVKIAKGTAKGTIIYLIKDFCMNGGTMTVNYGAPTPFAVAVTTPEVGSVLSAASAFVSVEFNKSVKVSSVAMKINEGAEQTVKYTVQSKFISIEAKDALVALYQNGGISEGDAIHFIIKGIATSNGEETLEDIDLTYSAGAKPVMLTSTVNTPGTGMDTFYSWIPESASNGLIQFNFDGALDTSVAPTAYLEFGNVEFETLYYNEPLTVRFFGDQLIAIDVRGKLRRPSDMLPNATEDEAAAFTSISIVLKGLVAADGSPVYSEGSGSIGSFAIQYPYEQINYSLASEFTPASGSIDGVCSIEIWYQETGGKLGYDGVQFAYISGGESKATQVMNDNIVKVENEAEGSVTLTVPVPSFARDADTQVVVSPYNLTAPDGLDHSSEITATYTTAGVESSEMTVVSATMVTKNDAETEITATLADLLTVESLEKLVANSYLEIATSIDDVAGCMVYEIDNLTTNEVVKSFYETTTKTAEGHWSFWLPIDYKLFEGNEYAINLKAYTTNSDFYNDKDSYIGTVNIKINGACQEYQYSSVKLIDPSYLNYPSNEPDFDLQSADENTFTLTFSDAVQISQAFAVLGSGASQDCSYVMSADNTAATFTIPDFVLTQYDSFKVSVQVKDMDGKILQGNNGEEENAFYTINFDAKYNLPVPEIVDPAEDATVESISALTFSYPTGLAYSYYGYKIEVYNKLRELVATSDNDNIQGVYEGAADYSTKVIVPLTSEIATSGYYTIVVPEAFFNVGGSGTGFGLMGNREFSYSVIVSSSEEPVPSYNISVTPVPGAVGSLKDFSFTFNDNSIVGWSWSAFPRLEDAEGNVLQTLSEDTNLGINWDVENMIYLHLNEEVTTQGTYRLVLPAGSVMLDDSYTNDTDIVFVYQVVTLENVVITPEEGEVESLYQLYLTFPDRTDVMWGSGYPTITLPSGDVVNVTNTAWGAGNNEVVAYLPEEYTAPGEYVFTIPTGSLNIDGGVNTYDMTFHYTIAGVSENVTITPATGTVESLHVFELTFVDREFAAWGSGNPTITLPNGDIVNITDAGFGDDWSVYNVLKLTTPEEYTEPGNYVLTLPAGCVTFGEYGEESNASDIKFKYNIPAPLPELVVTSDPESGSYLELLGDVILTYEGCMVSEWNYEYDGVEVPTLKLPSGEDKDVSMVRNYGSGMNQLAFEFSQYAGGFAEEGTYTFTIPAGYTTYSYDYIEYNLYENPLVFTWIVETSGVSLIFAGEEGAINVYTVDGIQVVNNGGAADIRNLNKGIYIINGKKVYINK